jgi:diacylglycerol kinase
VRAASLWQSFKYASAGLWYVFRTQRNAKIHSVFTLMVILLGLFLQLPLTQWAILVLTIGIVFFAEILNTVIEAIVDLVSPEFHSLAKVAKDAAAGAVFLMAIMAVIVGLLILGPPLWQVMFRD